MVFGLLIQSMKVSEIQRLGKRIIMIDEGITYPGEAFCLISFASDLHDSSETEG